MTLAGAGLTHDPKGCSTHEDAARSGQEGTSGKLSLVRLCGVVHRSSPLLCRGTGGRTARLSEPGSADTPASGAEGARDGWLVALQVHGTGLQGREMVYIEDGEFLIHDTLNGRI